MIKEIVFSILVSSVIAQGSIELPDSGPTTGEEFAAAIKRTVVRLQGVAKQRPNQLRPMNDSLDKTARAGRAMATGANHDEIFELLMGAQKDFDGNHFALLLEAVLRNSRGETEQANALFEKYLRSSRNFTKFDQLYMSWRDYKQLREGVYYLLLSKGISFEGKEREVQVTEFMKYILSSEGLDRNLNIILIAILLGGAVLIGLAALTQVDFNGTFAGFCLFLYILAWITYGIWMIDLIRGLPFGWTRFRVIPVFLGSAISLYVIAEVWRIIVERNRPLVKGYRRCPHCREPIPALTLECPVCRKSIKK